uniref:Uncharacterized protein n=1 Tax=Anser cygnoides TaxID=8845 RepID=A0A8B9DUY3_ANSCY
KWLSSSGFAHATGFWRAVLPVLRNWGLIRGRSASSTRGKTSKTNRLEPAKATKPIVEKLLVPDYIFTRAVRLLCSALGR